MYRHIIISGLNNIYLVSFKTYFIICLRLNVNSNSKITFMYIYIYIYIYIYMCVCVYIKILLTINYALTIKYNKLNQV